MNIEDIKYLRKILEDNHLKENGLSIKKCPQVDCWHRQMFDKLGLHSKKKKEKNER